MEHKEKAAIKKAVLNNNFIKGAISGFLAGTCLQPFEVIKTNSQINPFLNKTLNMREVSKIILQNEGMKGFYRGFTAACIKTSCSAGVYFWSLQVLNRMIRYTSNNIAIDNMLASGLARTVQALTTYPIVLIKSRLEVLGFNKYTGILNAFKTIYQVEGCKGYFTGITTTIIRDVPFSSLYYPIYEGVKKFTYRYVKNWIFKVKL